MQTIKWTRRQQQSLLILFSSGYTVLNILQYRIWLWMLLYHTPPLCINEHQQGYVFLYVLDVTTFICTWGHTCCLVHTSRWTGLRCVNYFVCLCIHLLACGLPNDNQCLTSLEWEGIRHAMRQITWRTCVGNEQFAVIKRAGGLPFLILTLTFLRAVRSEYAEPSAALLETLELSARHEVEYEGVFLSTCF